MLKRQAIWQFVGKLNNQEAGASVNQERNAFPVGDSARTSSSGRADILVIGGGVTGLGIAVALKQTMRDALDVALWNPALGQRSSRQRVTAVAAGPRRMLERLEAWREVERDAQPIHRMEVTDSRINDPVRPIFLSFEGDLTPGEPFAHMIVNADLEQALERRAADLGVKLRADSALSAEPAGSWMRVKSAQASEFRARLVVAADGVRSPLREAARIGSVGWDYGVSAIVCTVEHEREHGGCAQEHFLPGGPFAILPLAGRSSSIVWTEPSEHCRRIAALPPEQFLSELERRFGRELGAISVQGRPLVFGVSLNMARRLTAHRLALIGDAAHVIHPLAGQGLNLGLRDAAALAEAIVDQVRLGLDPGAPEVLRQYERRRRFDNTMMALATDLLYRLFSNDGPSRLARDLGLGLVERTPELKRLFTRAAAGVAGAPPRLLLGQDL